jgi:pilus assembly protein CpaB
MRMIFGLVLAVGVLLAGAAVFMAKNYIGQQQTSVEREKELIAATGGLAQVFVVNKPRNYGDPLTKDDVQMIYWPKNALPEGVFLDPKLLFPEDAKEPRYVVRQMEQFEPILAVKITEPGEQAGLNGSIEKGMRAFAIKVDAADFLQPGDRVDIYWTGSSDASGTEITQRIERAVKIIAVDRDDKEPVAASEIQSRTMTVAATPEQVGRLAQGQATGRLVMSLVGDDQSAATDPTEIKVTTKDINGDPDAAVAEVVAAPKECFVTMRQGGVATQVPVACTN